MTSALRKEQEEEAKIYERLRENRSALEEAELRYKDSSRRLSEARTGGNLYHLCLPLSFLANLSIIYCVS